MDPMFRPKASATGQPSQPSNDDFMYRMIPGSQGSSLRPNQESYRTGAAQTGGGVRRSSQGAGFQSLMPKVQSPALAQSAWPIQNQYVRTGLAQASPQRIDRSSPAWQQQFGQSFNDSMQADRQRQIDYANQRVDSRLAASQGNYPTPENRRAGFFGRGFNLSVPQPREERQLTFNPAQNAAANKALYDQHLQSMMNNPEYAARVLDQRAERRQQLDARDAIGDARRQGAIEAAGASQQLRNLMAGRGAIGPGRDGFAALMSMAAMQNPNAAFDNFGEGFMAFNAPNMLQQRLNAEQAMQGQRLGAEQAMQGQQIGAQERMLGQELASRRTIADMNVAAQRAQAEAERAFMAAQNTTNFEQQKALTELGYKHQRESDQFGAMMQAIMQAGNPRDARQMIGMIRDPDTALDPNLNPGIDVPGFSPSEGSAGDRQAQLFELFDWAQRNGFDTNHPRFKSELIERQLNPTPEEMSSMVRDLEWQQPLSLFSGLPGGQYRYGPFAPSFADQDRSRRHLNALRSMAGASSSPPANRPSRPVAPASQFQQMVRPNQGQGFYNLPGNM